jgi:putative ATPase
LNDALLSRCQVITLNRLNDSSLESILSRAEKFKGKNLLLSPEARSLLKVMSDGDGRYLLNVVEVIFSIPSKEQIHPDELIKIIEGRAPLYDKSHDSHYNLISALHKSLRGSDVDAGLYWLARMLVGGEDPRFIARRLVRFSVEDVGLADPNALSHTISAWSAYDRLGSPEGELALAQSVIYLATAPKSNAAYIAYGEAIQAAKEYGSQMPPKHILNAPTDLMREQGYGQGYEYDHNNEYGFSGQNYFPENMTRKNFYHPVARGYEKDIQKRLELWDELRTERSNNKNKE